MFKNLKYKAFNSSLAIKYFSKYTGLISYSQYGEDKILNFALKILKNRNLIKTISYLDLGGCFADKSSNTYFLYKQGYHGVVVEAAPDLAEDFKKIRKNDIVLNVGITDGEGGQVLPFYYADGVCGSFLKDNVLEAIQKYGNNSECRSLNVPTRNVNDIMREYFTDKDIFLVSIDVEGLDEQIIRGFDFKKYRPYFFCIETAELSGESFLGRKEVGIAEFMKHNGYEIYADTYVNTIFVRKDILEKMY